MTAPDRIWAWRFHKSAVVEEIHGGWTEKEDKRETEYIRADLADAQWNAAIRAAADAIRRDTSVLINRRNILALLKNEKQGDIS
jgi:uncharacterized protein (DUF736 family)